MKQFRRLERSITFNPEFTSSNNERCSILNEIEEMMKLIDDGGNFQITVGEVDYDFPRCKCKITLDYMEEDYNDTDEM